MTEFKVGDTVRTTVEDASYSNLPKGYTFVITKIDAPSEDRGPRCHGGMGRDGTGRFIRAQFLELAEERKKYNDAWTPEDYIAAGWVVGARVSFPALHLEGSIVEEPHYNGGERITPGVVWDKEYGKDYNGHGDHTYRDEISRLVLLDQPTITLADLATAEPQSVVHKPPLTLAEKLRQLSESMVLSKS